jgi:hypothetical protein
MFGIEWDKVTGVLRHLLTFGAGYLVAQGIVDEATSIELVGAAMTVIGVVWSWRAKSYAPKA